MKALTVHLLKGAFGKMNTALEHKNVYEDFEPKHDTLFFKVGSHGMISFHGKNYNIKRRMSTEQRSNLTSDASFIQVNADCYVNVDKIRSIESDYIYFGSEMASNKRIPVSRRKQQQIQQRLAEMKH